uniref:Uncharacterized protein n=1 Tax=Anguilla anguilla TaxID=7936 RepID=A0A0E9ULV8_ANGAN
MERAHKKQLQKWKNITELFCWHRGLVLNLRYSGPVISACVEHKLSNLFYLLILSSEL